MNLDMNTISMLMQLLTQKNGDNKAQNTAQESPNEQYTHVRMQDDKYTETSAFARQNGIGEKTRLDFSNIERQNDGKFDFIKNMAAQNPMFALLGNMQNGKVDVSSMLPLVMSMMQKSKTEKKNDDSASERNDEKNKSDVADSSVTESKIENEKANLKTETQREVFAPVAFAGYEVISYLCSLVKASRRPCR
ncbi:unknown [Firmicutes bacterium CAG:475]|nr:unknown [Firmicutes bacterium CAG:475]